MYLLLTNMVEIELGCRFSSNPCLAKPGSRLSFRVNEQLVGVSLHRHKVVEMHVTSLTQSGLMVSLGRCHEHPHPSVYMQWRGRGSPTYSLLAQKLVAFQVRPNPSSSPRINGRGGYFVHSPPMNNFVRGSLRPKSDLNGFSRAVVSKHWPRGQIRPFAQFYLALVALFHSLTGLMHTGRYKKKPVTLAVASCRVFCVFVVAFFGV